jgi:aminoglycoside phosphotransferase (APT) family kinase protein
MSNDDFVARLEAAVAHHIGAPGKIHNFQRLTGGANKTTYSFDADIGAKREPFILQVPAPAPPPDPNDPLAEYSVRITGDQDARLMIAAVKAGVPAPRVRAIFSEADGVDVGWVTERIEGETLMPRILREERYAGARKIMAAQCGEILAAIHKIDLAEVPFLKYLSAARQIESYQLTADMLGLRLPALELTLRWAKENLPVNPRHTVVHGDYRAGNFIVGDEGVRCILDWEGAQSGDPMQDMGWLCVKTWRFGGRNPVGGFGRREDLFATYEKASGHRVDPLHVRFWEAFGSTRWAIASLRLGTRGIEEIDIERSTIGRRIEEPLWDFLTLVEGRDS